MTEIVLGLLVFAVTGDLFLLGVLIGYLIWRKKLR